MVGLAVAYLRRKTAYMGIWRNGRRCGLKIHCQFDVRVQVPLSLLKNGLMAELADAIGSNPMEENRPSSNLGETINPSIPM